MKHRKSGKKLGRNTLQRQALIKNLLKALFTHGSIKTTQTKALALEKTAEKYCHLAIKASLTSRRGLYKLLQDRHWVLRVEKSLLSTFPKHTSNFLRIVRLDNRQGDDALIAKVSFIKPVSFKSQETKPAKKDIKKATKPILKKTTKKNE